MSDKIVQFNEDVIKDQLKELVRGSVGLPYMCYSSENRERKNSLCVKVKFTTNVHSPKEVFRCDHYNTGYAFSPITHSLCGPP